MTNFDDLHREPEEAPPFDREAFLTLANEFGGLAGWYIKEHEGGWSQEAWEEAMIRLYDQRHLLDGVEDHRERGYVALQVFSDATDQSKMLDRVAEKLKNKNRRSV